MDSQTVRVYVCVTCAIAEGWVSEETDIGRKQKFVRFPKGTKTYQGWCDVCFDEGKPGAEHKTTVLRISEIRKELGDCGAEKLIL